MLAYTKTVFARKYFSKTIVFSIERGNKRQVKNRLWTTVPKIVITNSSKI